jgi:hypothetical protein
MLCRRHVLIALMVGAPLVGKAQQPTVLKPMTTLRIGLTAGTVSGRLVGVDSTTLTLQLSDGNLVPYARRDIASIERRGSNAKRGAKRFGVAGAIIGAAYIGTLAVGLCETGDCGKNALPGAAVGGALGAAFGVVVGAGLGAMAGRWLPVSTDVRMNGSIMPVRAATYSCVPRFELQLGVPTEMISTIGRGGHFGIGASCGSRGVYGLEWGAIDRPRIDSTSIVSDTTFGELSRLSQRKTHATFGSAFAEIPLGHSRFHPQLIASGGVYSVTREWAEVLNPLGSVDYNQFWTQRPNRNEASTSPALGAGIGFKAWMPLGSNFAAGLAARMHIVGSDATRLLESGVTVSYRP